jgi:hypothetical protein
MPERGAAESNLHALSHPIQIERDTTLIPYPVLMEWTPSFKWAAMCLQSIQLFAQNRFPVIILTVNLKNGFCQINANGSHPHGERSFSLGGETAPNVGTFLPI